MIYVKYWNLVYVYMNIKDVFIIGMLWVGRMIDKVVCFIYRNIKF